MSKDLSSYFAKSVDINSGRKGGVQQSYTNDDESMGPTVSMAVEAKNDDHFEKSTFNLKRTRSMGLFNDFIDSDKTSDDSSNASLDTKNLGNSKGIPNQGSNSKSHKHFLKPHRNGFSGDSVINNYSDDDNEDDISMDDINATRLSASASPPPADNDNLLIPQDDNDLVREPETHVDYLSHHWNESDISNSWKYIILKKKKRDVIDSVNSARLENASWRTWAKARNHLSTVSPEVVNWSKDSDVTWLYGPVLSSNNENDDDNNNMCPEDDIQLGYGSDDETSKRLTKPLSMNAKSKLKPILKKRTVTEIIEENSLWKLNQVRKYVNDVKNASVMIDANGNSIGTPTDEYNDYELLAGKLNAQYYGNSNKGPGPGQGQMGTSVNKDTTSDVENATNFLVPSNNNQSSKESSHSSINNLLPVEDQSNAFHSVSSMSSANESSNSQLNVSAKNSDINVVSTSNPGQPALPLLSILTSSNPSKAIKNIPNRHIHFNDRVEQCISIAYSEFEQLSPSENNSSDEETNKLQGYDHGNMFAKDGNYFYDPQNNTNEDSLLSSSSSDEEEDEDCGLFINARYSRRLNLGTHSPVTDSSSMGSGHGRIGVNPIIKLIPATTLNYGSDDESDNTDYENSYGNAVSHNVNTYRGYDYVYDYNTVYTGDTSNFLPMDHSGVEDIPEGINLQTSIADDTIPNYNHNIPAANNLESSNNSGSSHFDFSYNDSDSDNMSSTSEQQFIEHSRDQSSEEDDDDFMGGNGENMELRRTASLGKTTNSGSLKDITNNNSVASLATLGATRSFITGKTISQPDIFQSNFIAKPAIQTPILSRPSNKQKSFILDSESDSEE